MTFGSGVADAGTLAELEAGDGVKVEIGINLNLGFNCFYIILTNF